jgi:hypothetical protein
VVDENRFNRLEDKVDRLDEKVDSVDKTTVEIKAKLERHVEVVEQQVTGDNKIITHIEPLIPHLGSIAEMAKDHQYQKMKRQERKDKLGELGQKIKIWGSLLTLASVVLGILAKYTNLL